MLHFNKLSLSFLLVVVLPYWNPSCTTAWTPKQPLSQRQQQQHQTNDDKVPISSNSLITTTTTTTTTTRRSFLPVLVTATVTSTTAIILGPTVSIMNSDSKSWMCVPTVATAVGIPENEVSKQQQQSNPNNKNNNKLNISDNELIQILRDDIIQRQFLVTGNITKSIYAVDATFTDEIDTYSMDQWMIGTQRLFVGNKSQVRLVNNNNNNENNNNNNNPITFTSPTTIEFHFDEDLMFNLPFIKPIVSLTGKVILTRDSNTGYITSYREYWDQDVATVLKNVKF